eukprot:g77137.t1
MNLLSNISGTRLPCMAINIGRSLSWSCPNVLQRWVQAVCGFSTSSQAPSFFSKLDAKSEDPPIYRVVLTGGPCGGKTTAKTFIMDRLRSLGFRVFAAPETATYFIAGGVDFASNTSEQNIAAHTALIKATLAVEDAFLEVARAMRQPAVLLCDRGAMDVSAYMSAADWQTILRREGWTVSDLRDRRYDLVCHMATAAYGAEQFYTLSNNPSRRETPEQARAVDQRIKQSWLGASRIFYVDNYMSFTAKLQRVLQAICRLVGVPGPAATRRRFLLAPVPPDKASGSAKAKSELEGLVRHESFDIKCHQY